MHRDSSFSLYAAQIFFVGLIVIISLSLASILITVLGSNTVLAASKAPASHVNEVNIYESPNIIADGGAAAVGSAQNVAVSAGRNLYANCKWVTGAITKAGTSTVSSISDAGGSVVHGSATVIRGAGSGIAFVSRGVGKVAMLPFKLPAKAVSSLSRKNPLHNIVRPAESADNKEVPIINGQTSAKVLARYNAEQKKQIAEWLESQKTANQHLGGLVVAGSDSRGGYPAKWANAPQDSLLDKWGMYNRECVSYAAWKVYQTYGFMPNWGGVGNANQWLGNARAAGIKTSSTPKENSVAISMNGYYGHAMWVERVEGKMVYVSQYNYDLAGHYSEMWVKASNLTYIYFK